MRVVSVLMGVLLALTGAVALFMPELTFFSISWIIGISLIIESIGETISLMDRRKTGKASAWGFFSAAVSLIVGLVLISSIFAREVISSVLIYLIAGWVIVLGFLVVMKGIKDGKGGNFGWFSILIGLLMIAFGVLGIFSPAVIAVSTGMFAGIAVLLSGVSLIATSISY